MLTLVIKLCTKCFRLLLIVCNLLLSLPLRSLICKINLDKYNVREHRRPQVVPQYKLIIYYILKIVFFFSHYISMLFLKNKIASLFALLEAKNYSKRCAGRVW